VLIKESILIKDYSKIDKSYFDDIIDLDLISQRGVR